MDRFLLNDSLKDRVCNSVQLPFHQKIQTDMIFNQDKQKYNIDNLKNIFLKEGILSFEAATKILNDVMKIF